MLFFCFVLEVKSDAYERFIFLLLFSVARTAKAICLISHVLEELVIYSSSVKGMDEFYEMVGSHEKAPIRRYYKLRNFRF